MPQQTGRFELNSERTPADWVHRTGTILIIEDDPEVRELLSLFLTEDEHQVTAASDGVSAMNLLSRGLGKPDLILADYNLPDGQNGLQIATKLRTHFRAEIPVIILTGDISTEALHAISLQSCVKLNKPVKAKELRQVLQRLLPMSPARASAQSRPSDAGNDSTPAAVIYIVDDDRHVRESMRAVLEDDGRTVVDYATCEDFLADYRPDHDACLLLDAYLPGMSGLDLLQRLHGDGHSLPTIMITGNSDVSVAVQAMKAGAVDFIEKPVSRHNLIASIDRALEQSRDAQKLHAWRATAASQLATLSTRQRQIMAMVLDGQPSKIIAADLGISQRTVEGHRATIMKKTGCKSLPALARLALATPSSQGDPGPMRSRTAPVNHD